MSSGKLAHNVPRTGARDPVLRLRQGYGACALLWDGLLEHYFSNVNSVSLGINYMNKIKSVTAPII